MGYEVHGTIRTRTFRVLWALEEMGLDYVHHAEMPHSGPIRALNPSGKVPVLVTKRVAITDSTAILTFLADRHGQLTYPAGSLERARQDGLTQAILDELDALIWTAARHSFILPEEMRVAEIKPSLKWEFGRNAARIADRLQGAFLMGEAMTIPDILLAHCLGWAITAKFGIEDRRLADWHATMRQRPAYRRVTGEDSAPET